MYTHHCIGIEKDWYERNFKEAAIMKVQIQKSHPSEKIEDPSENFEKIHDTHI